MNEELKGLLTIISNNALSIEGITQNIGTLVASIGNINNNVIKLSEDVTENTSKLVETNEKIDGLDKRLVQIEESEEIKTYQKEKIVTAVHRRIYQLLGENKMDHVKYFRIFCLRLYGDARRQAGLAKPIGATEKKNYDRIMEFIENWRPAIGCDQLKLEADNAAERRRIAKEQGYVS